MTLDNWGQIARTAYKEVKFIIHKNKIIVFHE